MKPIYVANRRVDPALAYGWKQFNAELEAQKLAKVLSPANTPLRHVPEEARASVRAFRELSQEQRLSACRIWIREAVMGYPFSELP